MAQPGESPPHGLEDIDGAIAVLNIGGVHEDEDEKPAGIGQDVALPALDLLARVIATRAAAFGGFDRLTVDHTGTRGSLATLDLAQVHDQHRVHCVEQARVAPGVKIALDRRDRREAFGQKPPGATARRNVEQGVQDFAHVRCPTPTAPLGRRDERRCQRPLPIRHIAGIAQSLSAMLPSGNISPCHGSLHLSQDGVNHNMLVLLNNFWVRLLGVKSSVRLTVMRG
tara:strand:+ start:4056 stop:4733 length:678 start_codon:yes stop_codon:yes gene_type:complete